MDRIGDMSHSIWETSLIPLQTSIVTSLRNAPAIVQHDIFIPDIAETVVDDFGGRGEEKIFGDGAAECIPVVLIIWSVQTDSGNLTTPESAYPTHLRCHRQAIVGIACLRWRDESAEREDCTAEERCVRSQHVHWIVR